MKAITYTRFGPPEVLQLQDVPQPAPRAKEILVRIHASTVCKEDPDMRATPGFNGLLKPAHPILGQEFAGDVVAIGPEVKSFKPGDQVFGIDTFGAYAEYKCLSEQSALAIKPAGLTYAEAASVPNGALTALPFGRFFANTLVFAGWVVLGQVATSAAAGTFTFDADSDGTPDADGVGSAQMVLAGAAGITPVIVLTKADTADPALRAMRMREGVTTTLAIFEPLGVRGPDARQPSASVPGRPWPSPSRTRTTPRRAGRPARGSP